jgi:hypothetical protein
VRIALLTRRKGEQRWRTPAVTAYTAEAELEAMLRASPELLPGEDEARPIATLSVEAQEQHERRERVYREG